MQRREQAKSPAPAGAGLFCNPGQITDSMQVTADVLRSAENFLRFQILLLQHIADQIRWPTLHAKLRANGERSVNTSLNGCNAFQGAGLNHWFGDWFHDRI